MRLALLRLWSWKKGVSTYAQACVKKNSERFRRCLGSPNPKMKDTFLDPVKPRIPKVRACRHD